MKAKRPKLFQSKTQITKSMQNIGDALVQGALDVGMKAIQQFHPTDEEVKVKRMPKYLQVTEKRLNKLGVIDLKPYFEASSHRKEKKDGSGWYVIVPIRRKKKSMSRRMYDQLRAFPVEPNTSRTVISDYLYDRRRVSGATELNYEPKSNNITKQAGSNGRSLYIAYRTISDKSPASSWIVNRDKVNTDDSSKTFMRNVNRLMRWKMKNM
jgi:hypothetical protein